MSHRRTRPDRGFTLIEVLVVMAIQGIIVSAVAAAFIVFIRTTPSSETRIDDARSTRGLATWMSHDVTSAPHFEPADPVQGGIDVSSGANRCGITDGSTNIVELRWTQTSFTTDEFVAGYRYVSDGDSARIVRYSCSPSGAMVGQGSLGLTSGLDPANPPVVTFARNALGEVDSITLSLTAIGGQQVAIVTGSRNPTETF